jgi:hypothetical protein
MVVLGIPSILQILIYIIIFSTFEKNIIEAHGEQIWAENRDGKGATFGFSLPIIE